MFDFFLWFLTNIAKITSGEDNTTNDHIPVPVFSSFKKPSTDKDKNNDRVTKLADRNVVDDADPVQNESINSSDSDSDQQRHHDRQKSASVNNIQNRSNNPSQSSNNVQNRSFDLNSDQQRHHDRQKSASVNNIQNRSNNPSQSSNNGQNRSPDSDSDQQRYRNHQKSNSINNVQNHSNDPSQSPSSTTISNPLHVNLTDNSVNYVSYYCYYYDIYLCICVIIIFDLTVLFDFRLQLACFLSW